MKNKIKNFFTPAKILAIISIFCAALITVSFFSDKLVSPLREAVSVIITPLQRGMNGLGIGIVEHKEKKKTIEELQQYNSELEDRIEKLEAANKQLKSDTADLETLRDLYKLDGSLSDYPKVGASIIGVSSQNWNDELIIDKGRNDGIEEDMNVIADDGLVGIITEVHGNYSKVLTVISDNSYVSATNEVSKDKCTVKGDLSLMDNGRLRLERIKGNALINNGDRIITSEISSKYIPGILIGYAQDVTADEADMSKSGYVIPAVDFDHLQKVLIITQKKQVED